MIDKKLIHQAAEDIDIFEADLTEKFERLRKSQLRESKPSAVTIALRTVSTIAATLLIGLFLYQQNLSQKTNEVPYHNISRLSAGSTLRDVYTCRQQQAGLITYNQLRKMLYENK